MTLGTRLRKYIEVKGMTITDFAKSFGIPYRSVHEYLSDKRKPGAEHLEKMIHGGIDIEWLLIGNNKLIISFDFSDYASQFKPIEGIAACNRDISGILLDAAVTIVDRFAMDNPSHVTKLGIHGTLASVYHIWSMLSEALEASRDAFISSINVGRPADDFCKQLVELVTPFITENLALMFHKKNE